MNSPSHACGRSVVLGASGFIGSRLARALQAGGEAVTGFSRKVPVDGSDTVFDAYACGDLSDGDALRAIIGPGDAVFHCVGSADPRQGGADALVALERHIAATLSLFEMCAEAGVASLVFVSSGGTVYGPTAPVPTAETAALAPISPYGAAKAAIEMFAGSYRHTHGLPVRIARVANPYGPGQAPGRGQGFIATCMAATLEGEPIRVWGDGTTTRDFIYIDDVTDGLIALARYEGRESVFNLGSGEGRAIGQVARDIAACCGTDSPVEHLPAAPADVPASVLDIARARRELGWSPRMQWASGLEHTRAWLEGR